MMRDEHLEWAKERARECLRRGEWRNAITGMSLDLLQGGWSREMVGMLTEVAFLRLEHQGPRTVVEWVEGWR